MKTWIGIDISKDKLDLSDGQRHWQIDNTPRALKKFCASLTEDTHLLCEASGGYEFTLVEAAHHASVAISVLHATRVKHFRMAQGKVAKNDRIDAEVIRLFGEAFHPQPDPESHPDQLRLNELFLTRLAFMGDLTQCRNRKRQARLAEVRRQYQSLIQTLENKIEVLNEKISKLLQSDFFAPKAKALQSIKGVGIQTTTAILSLLPELGTLNRGSVASLVGVAPMDCESGSWKGSRRIQGGRANLRRCVYMAALVASTHNPISRATYQHLLKEGKEKKVALVAVMRKLIIHCNTILKPLVQQP